MTDLDDASVALARAYQAEGSAAFIVRTTEGGDVRVIGLSLPGEMVARMLRAAADAFERKGPREVVN